MQPLSSPGERSSDPQTLRRALAGYFNWAVERAADGATVFSAYRQMPAKNTVRLRIARVRYDSTARQWMALVGTQYLESQCKWHPMVAPQDLLEAQTFARLAVEHSRLAMIYARQEQAKRSEFLAGVSSFLEQLDHDAV
ncbi:hypothetical protein AB4Z48_26540 [Cupriavidus sp. 2TAF22]|uniref:hypothetical protein n=1 Tax=unclassified Cupriavidus TaxID=2640874 RepID=UPI003F9036E5